ncbi:hypothetical protein [Spirosoma lituiforme]
MDGKTHPADKLLIDQSTYTTVLANWFEAVSTFYNHYNQLRPYIAQVGINNVPSINSGQCPVGQLRRLLSRMHRELDMLVQDMDQIDAPESNCTRQQCKKLVNHTRVLTQLNQRAQTMCLLINLSAS